MLRRTFSTVLVVAAAAGCAVFRGSMDIDYNDRRLNDGLERVRDSGEPARLSEFTNWQWDEVHLFHEFSDREFIEKTVGEPVIKDDFYGSKASLLVFENDGAPVKAAGISGDYLRGADHKVTWPADVIVAPQGSSGFLLLSLPPG